MTLEYDASEYESDSGPYRVNVGITNEITNTRWEPGDTLQAEDIPAHVLKLYVERNYLEDMSESNG